MLQAMSTGHEGSMTTTHANNALEALHRIETLCMMAGLPLAPGAIREQVTNGIDVVVQQSRFSDGSRRVTAVVEVLRTVGRAPLQLRPLFRFQQSGTDAGGQVVGEHQHTGLLASFAGDFALLGPESGEGDR